MAQKICSRYGDGERCYHGVKGKLAHFDGVVGCAGQGRGVGCPACYDDRKITHIALSQVHVGPRETAIVSYMKKLDLWVDDGE